MSDSEARWIQWWCAPWQWAHPAWKAPFLALVGAAEDDLMDAPQGLQTAFLHSAQIEPCQPPTPVNAVLQWLALPADQQHQALELAARICLTSVGDGKTQSPTSVYEGWCRAVAKALRPGVWLDPAIDDPRLLLAAWVGEDCWSRLRLSWPPQAVQPAVTNMPSNKLHTLWQSVLWRVTTP
ncbi:hypothetical protein SAMN03159444_00334 [Pseudomonas sp. NFACC02]|uniref:type III secretion protein n=1 Tax=Pseudomonas sp. NFACC02 TaxID=1566250 RepID=UPI0008B8D3A2|nr:type III secretion protein [Pseudomonas sp. NFACC02]SEP66086.1 hypothetical protein SAMN03159444_00334 [Pseudomonas sp. NFACC02]